MYGETKYAIKGLSEGLTTELAPLGTKVTSVAPGLFTTDFVSTDSYLRSAPVLDAYRDTVGVTRDHMEHFHGSQPGDPKKLAEAIIKLSASNNPPLNLPIGRDAIKNIREKITQITKEAEECEALAQSADHH